MNGYDADSERPGVEDEGPFLAVHQNDVEHIEGIHRGDARHQRLLAVPVKRLQSEATGIHLPPLIHELLQPCIEVQVTIKSRIAELGESTHHTEGDAGAIQQYRGFKTFVDQTTGLQQIDQADGTFESHCVKRDQGFFTRISLHIGEYFFLVVNKIISRLVGGTVDDRHVKKP